jgi:nitrile hydratase accessory protein
MVTAITPLPLQPHDDAGPVFAEPWQAQVFALTLELSHRGLFSWGEWTEILSQQIKAAQAAGDPDLGDTYYDHWAQALEKMIECKGVISVDVVDERTEAWRQAYLSTPHGEPIKLIPGLDF